jgi:hypothetical protein
MRVLHHPPADVALVYGLALFGTPLVATWLLAAGGGRPWFLGAYMMGAALVTVISVFALPETYQRDIDPVMAPAPDPEPEPAVKS